MDKNGKKNQISRFMIWKKIIYTLRDMYSKRNNRLVLTVK